MPGSNTVTTTTTTSPANNGIYDESNPYYHETTQPLLAVWSTDTLCSFNGNVLSFEGSLGFDGIDLFQDANVALERGCIYGLVAPNGSGKTSLMRSLPSLPDFPTGSRFPVEYLAADLYSGNFNMEEENEDWTARDYCLNRVSQKLKQLDQEIELMEKELELTEDNDQMETLSNLLGEVYETRDDLEQDAACQVDQMIEGLNFGGLSDCPFVKLSSGWRYKCQLVSAILTRPALLAIDEPSFLDKQATAWLVTRLDELAKSQNAIIILISHKEDLMDELCDRILYLNPASKTLILYHCGFREFQSAHAERVAVEQKRKDHADAMQHQAKSSLGNIRKELQKRELSYKAKLHEYARGEPYIRGKNKEAKQNADHSAASKLKRLEKAAKQQEEQQALYLPTRVEPLELQGADVSGSTQPLMEMVDVDFQYEGSQEMLLEYVNLQITGTDKILVQGGNGQGKSTLVKLFLGQLKPSSGEVRRHCQTIAYFHQDALLDLIYKYGHHTPVEFVQTKNPSLTDVDTRTHLGRFGLRGNIAIRPLRTLSAGQRVRTWLSREFLDKAHKPSLLILDEVTENLDRETTDSLLESLDGFSAAILAISHDAHFCQEFPATQDWNVGHGRVMIQFR